MFAWPDLELSDYERRFVRPYKTETHDGVLRRTYERTISNNNAIPLSLGLKPSEQVQIARRTRVFGITFSGSIASTRLQITNAAGTLYNVKDPRTGKFPYITSLIGGSPYMFGSRLGRDLSTLTQSPNAGDPTWLSNEAGILLIEPNWVLTPNSTLIFNGYWTDIEAAVQPAPTLVVNIMLHVWEFPTTFGDEELLKQKKLELAKKKKGGV